MPYRTNGRGQSVAIEFLLVTSRQTRRWIIPKGNIDFHMAPHAAAEQEAEEEAGAIGDINAEPLGSFHYYKRLESGAAVKAKVVVFPLPVRELLDDWQEKPWRLRRWFSRSEAAEAVQEPELKEIIRSFSPPG